MKDLSNFANIGVNSIITDKERLTESMRKFLYDRVWCDDDLLEGFTQGEIDEIISRTLDRDFSTISQFLAVLLEDEANEYMKEPYKYFPQTKDELRSLIEQRIEDEGNAVNLNDIDVSKITDMSKLFLCSDFNGDISGWDVSNVTNMNSMFDRCFDFNQDLSKWNVSKVTDMNGMFFECKSFNKNISSWDVSNVTDMNGMFAGCINFNQDLSKWNVSNVEDMEFMFDGCKSFNQDISNWNVSKVTDMSFMFDSCIFFNQDLSEWDVSNVISMRDMFYECPIKEEYKPNFK